MACRQRVDERAGGVCGEGSGGGAADGGRGVQRAVVRCHALLRAARVGCQPEGHYQLPPDLHQCGRLVLAASGLSLLHLQCVRILAFASTMGACLYRFQCMACPQVLPSPNPSHLTVSLCNVHDWSQPPCLIHLSLPGCPALPCSDIQPRAISLIWLRPAGSKHGPCIQVVGVALVSLDKRQNHDPAITPASIGEANRMPVVSIRMCKPQLGLQALTNAAIALKKGFAHAYEDVQVAFDKETSAA